MIQKEKIEGYSVIGYDKDNDVFICYGKYEVLANADFREEKLHASYHGMIFINL